jgi:hypothetical protein
MIQARAWSSAPPIPDGTTGELAFEVWMDCPEGASLTWAVDSIGVTSAFRRE